MSSNDLVTMYLQGGGRLSIDSQWYMTESVGRLVSPYSFGAVQYVLSDNTSFAPGNYNLVGVNGSGLFNPDSRADNLKFLGTSFSNYMYPGLDGTFDWMSRAYINGSSGFKIASGIVNVDENGNKTILSLQIKPLDDDLNFYSNKEGGGFNYAVNAFNYGWNTLFDYNRNGKKVEFEFRSPNAEGLYFYDLTKNGYLGSVYVRDYNNQHTLLNNPLMGIETGNGAFINNSQYNQGLPSSLLSADPIAYSGTPMAGGLSNSLDLLSPNSFAGAGTGTFTGDSTPYVDPTNIYYGSGGGYSYYTPSEVSYVAPAATYNAPAITYNVPTYTPDPYEYGGGGGYYYFDQGFDPIALDLDGDGVEIVQFKDSNARFDFGNDGFREHTSWLSGDDGFLVIDANNNGLIDQDKELSLKLWDSRAKTDLEGLKLAFDTNNDGVFDVRDARFNELKVWQDKNGDGVTDAGELKTLAEVGLKSIKLTSDNQAIGLMDGTISHGLTTWTGTDNKTHDVSDLALRYNTNGTRRVETATKPQVIMRQTHANDNHFTQLKLTA